MKFKEIVDQIRNYEAKYRAQGYDVSANYEVNAYRLTLSKDKLMATIRDGYFNEKDFNTSPVDLVSFEAFFSVDGQRYAHYISDYPMEEYPERLSEAFQVMDVFFEGKYTVTRERYFVFWQKSYLNISAGDKEYHFIEVPPTS